MTDRLFDLAIYLLRQSRRHIMAAIELYKQHRWFDAYFLGLWGKTLRRLGNAVGHLATWLGNGRSS